MTTTKKSTKPRPRPERDRAMVTYPPEFGRKIREAAAKQRRSIAFWLREAAEEKLAREA